MSSRSFDGVNQFLKKINAPVGIRGAAGWAKTDTSGTQTIWHIEHRTFLGVLALTFSIRTVAFGAVNKLIASIQDNGPGLPKTVTSSNSVALNTWFHWGVRWDSQIQDKIYVYADGSETASTGTTGKTPQQAPRHAIASDFPGGNYFSGEIANVAAWGSLITDGSAILSHHGGRHIGHGQASGSYILGYDCEFDHDDQAQFGERVAGGGASWKFNPQNSPTFSNDDPNVFPLVGFVGWV